MQIGAATVEHCMFNSVLQNLKDRMTIWPSNFTPEYTSEENKHIHLERYLHPNAYSSITAKIWKPPKCPWTGKQIRKRCDTHTHTHTHTHKTRGFPGGSDCEESTCNATDLGSIPGSGRSPGQKNVYPLQYSCLDNSMDRGAWQETLHGVTKGRTQLSNKDAHTLTIVSYGCYP